MVARDEAASPGFCSRGSAGAFRTRGSLGLSLGLGAEGPDALTVLRIRESNSKSGRLAAEAVGAELGSEGAAPRCRGSEGPAAGGRWRRGSRAGKDCRAAGREVAESCLGTGTGMRSSGFQSTVRAKLGLFRVTSFLMWLNCWSCSLGSRSGVPGRASRGMVTAFSLRALSPSSSSGGPDPFPPLVHAGLGWSPSGLEGGTERASRGSESPESPEPEGPGASV